MRPLRMLLTAVLAAAPLAVVTAGGARAADPPAHTLSVSGTGVGMYPAYDSSVRRYAATTTQATFPSNAGGDKTANTGASITVSATTSDPSGKVLVNGVPMAGTEITLDDVDAGEEISVVYVDAGGREADSVYVLPADFPKLTATIKGAGITPGLVGLTLFQVNTNWPQFAAVVDQNGVPAWAQAKTQIGIDLKRQPNGHYSISRATTTADRTGSQIVEMGARFQTIATHETVGLTDTDNHDSILRSNGSKVLIAYEPNPDTGRTDSVIQEIGPSGAVVFHWDSRDLVDETVTPNQINTDYAHINSVQVVNDGQDFLASFRGLSAVLLIARKAHDGYAPGDIVWKLGGRDSTLSFVDDPYGGPCAQHTASELPNGDIMIFDDGSVTGLGDGPNCVNRANPSGALVPRTQSRVTVYRVDTDANTATLVRSYQPSGWFSWFMGSAQYLPSTGNVMVGWAAETDAVTEEVGPDDNPVWRLVATKSSNDNYYISYRATKFAVPDAIKPKVAVETPAAGATYALDQDVATNFSCTDAGGSTLQTCGSKLPGRPLDTSTPGTHTYRVTATDGAGNSTTVTRKYTVSSFHRPDVMVKKSKGGWLGARVYGGARDQTATWKKRKGSTADIAFALVNRGNYADRCRVSGSKGKGGFSVTYTFDGRDVTKAVRAGTWRSPQTGIGAKQVLHAKVRIASKATRGASRTFTVRCVSPAGGPSDTAGARVQVR